MSSKPIFVGTIVGISVAVAGVVLAGYELFQSEEQSITSKPQSLAAIDDRPVSGAIESEGCDPAAQPRDKHRIAGTAIGAIVGGAVGNDVGDSDVTTAAGAAAGAFAGHEIQKRLQEEKQENATAGDCLPSGN